MRKTRTSARVPLQTITAQDNQKKKEAGLELPVSLKLEDITMSQKKWGLEPTRSTTRSATRSTARSAGARGKPGAARFNSSFTELKVKPEPLQTAGDPHETKLPNSAGLSSHKAADHVAADAKRPSSPSRVQSPAKRVKKEEQSDDDLSSDSDEELTYEQLRERNMRDNQAFFSSLGIDQAKQDLRLSSKKVVKTPAKRAPPKPRVVLPSRRSLRLQRIDISGEPLPPLPEPEPVVDEHPRLPPGPVKMLEVVEGGEDEEEDHHTILTSALTSVTPQRCHHPPHSADLDSFVSTMKGMRITVKAKVCKDRLFSVAVHPSTNKVLAIAGDKWGRLGFWDISAKDQDRSVVTYRPHSRPIGHIAVTPDDPLKVYTCSYDSTLRCAHIERGVFDLLYSVPEEEDDLFRSFDFLSPTSMLLAQFRGDVALLDTRTPGQAQKTFAVCDKYLRTVSVHPSNTNFFVTAGNDMKVSVWDLRHLKHQGSKPLHAMMHGRSVSSAYFSPLTGSRILSCCADDSLNVFSCSSSCGEVTRSKSISHNNKTGRWLTPFRAVWHPRREDVFFVGSMKTPRRMEGFSVNGRVVHEFQGDVLSSVCSVVQFHPALPFMIGGNSSGYLFPFM